MSDLGRMTTKKLSISELMSLVPDDNMEYKMLIGLELLIEGYFPIPPIYFRQSRVGGLELIGDYSRNIVYTLRYWFQDNENNQYKRYREITAVIFEVCPEQFNLIARYQQLGFL